MPREATAGRAAATWRWRDCQEDQPLNWVPVQPADPQVCHGWIDPRLKTLHVWDGQQWVCVPSD